MPELPSFSVGFDVALKELKMKLLKDDQGSMLVVTGPGECGKTTLATKFCQDEEVKGMSLYMICLITCSSKVKTNRFIITHFLLNHDVYNTYSLVERITALHMLELQFCILFLCLITDSSSNGSLLIRLFGIWQRTKLKN